MTKAEERANEAYKDHPVWKALYQEGYEQAEEDFIEKALDYIENNIYDHYDGDNEYGVCGGYVKKEEFIKNFKNHIKGE